MSDGVAEDVTERDARRLPTALRKREWLVDGDYAWRIDDLPDVILTARDAGLINLGGELQFRSSFGYFTCPDVVVDLRGNLYDGRVWETQIDVSADEALAQLARDGASGVTVVAADSKRAALDAYRAEAGEFGVARAF